MKFDAARANYSRRPDLCFRITDRLPQQVGAGIGDPGGAAISGGTGGTDPGYNSSTARGEALALEPAALGPKPRSTSKAGPQRSRLFADGSADILFGRHEIDPVPFGGGVSDKPIP